MNSSEIIARLKEGNRRFMEGRMESVPLDPSYRAELVSGQNPWAIVLTCSDSRVVPEAIFNTGLGDLFVVRVAGNVANTCTIASMEFAVANLKTPVIVVMGHQNCGAVTAAKQSRDGGENLSHLLSHIAPALEAAGEDASVNDVAKTHAELTVQTLLEQSKIIEQASQAGEVKLIAAYYDLVTGEVTFL